MSLPATIEQQADFVEHLISRCIMRDGAAADTTLLMLESREIDDLRLLADRLRRMAPHESAIKRLVTGQ